MCIKACRKPETECRVGKLLNAGCENAVAMRNLIYCKTVEIDLFLCLFHGQVIKKEVGDTHTIKQIPFTFATTGDAESLQPSIQIDFERNLTGHWNLILEGDARKVSKEAVFGIIPKCM